MPNSQSIDPALVICENNIRKSRELRTIVSPSMLTPLVFESSATPLSTAVGDVARA